MLLQQLGYTQKVKIFWYVFPYLKYLLRLTKNSPFLFESFIASYNDVSGGHLFYMFPAFKNASFENILGDTAKNFY